MRTFAELMPTKNNMFSKLRSIFPIYCSKKPNFKITKTVQQQQQQLQQSNNLLTTTTTTITTTTTTINSNNNNHLKLMWNAT